MAVRSEEEEARRQASRAEPHAPGAKPDRNPFAGGQYRWWWATTFLASLAIGLQLVTVPTFVLDRTDTRFFVALAVICQTVPAALFTLLGGAAADRFGRRRIMLITFTIAAATAVAYVLLSLAGTRQFWPAFLIAAVIGAAGAFQNPARQSLINRLAPGPRLQNGVILGTLAFMGGQSMIGPAVGGLTVDRFGLTAGFALEVALLLLAMFCASRLVGIDNDRAGRTQAGPGIRQQIGEGLRYVRTNERIWQLLVLGFVPGLCFMGVGQAAFPILARDTFQAGARGIGLLNAGMGFGILFGSVLLAAFGPRTGRGRWLARTLPVGGACFLLAGLAPTLALAVLMLAMLGMGAAVFINYASTLIQTYVEPRVLGRVMSVWSLCFMAAVPLGNLHAGVSLSLFENARVVLAYSGILAALLGTVALVTLRAARSLD